MTLAQVFHIGHKLMVCGNGGSATDAQHEAVEFMHPITVGRGALPSICLTNDMAMVTAVANDVGFDDVFVRQIIAPVMKAIACIIGEVAREPRGIVSMVTGFGGTRIVDVLVGEQLPRIC